MKAIIGYNGIPSSEAFYETSTALLEYINTLRKPAAHRPNHIIIETNNLELVNQIIGMLYASQIFAIWKNKLYGGTDYTRRFLCVHHHFQDGGEIRNLNPETKYVSCNFEISKRMQIEIDAEDVSVMPYDGDTMYINTKDFLLIIEKFTQFHKELVKVK